MLMLIAAELQIRQNKYIFNQSNIYNNVQVNIWHKKRNGMFRRISKFACREYKHL